MKKLFSNRKTLYVVFGIVLVSIFSLTIVYAALSTVLKISGNAEVIASSWNIYLDNVELMSGSCSSNMPVVVDKTTISFSTTLKNPGDYYVFTVDVINSGSIDAMIDSIEKTPELTSEQAKYLNYEVLYQNGESINTRQLVEVNSFVRLKVKVALRTDILSSDLPQSAETLDLSFKVNYVQADESDTSSIINSGKSIKVLSGNYDTVGSEICIGDECFYVISSTENDVTMLAKYNLYVGYSVLDSSLIYENISNPTGIQNSLAIGGLYDEEYNHINFPWYGTLNFSNSKYWSNPDSLFTLNVYSEECLLFSHVENYKKYLENNGVSVFNARVISVDELLSLGCSFPEDSANGSCLSAPSFVYATTYWTSDATGKNSSVFRVSSWGGLRTAPYTTKEYYGIRPVITISKSEF